MKLTLQTRALAVVAHAAAYLAGMEAGWTQSFERLAEERTSLSLAARGPHAGWQDCNKPGSQRYVRAPWPPAKCMIREITPMIKRR
jgi:hypothetical protein